MNRMGWQDRITSIMRSPEILYAVGQGALALEIRAGDERVKDVLRGAGDWKAEWSTGSERGLLRELEGGCSVPVGIEAWIEEVAEGSTQAREVTRGPFEGMEPDEEEFRPTAPLLHQSGGKGKLAVLHVTACVTSVDGKKQVMHDSGKVLIKSFLEAERWGHWVAQELMRKGGKEILDEINVVRKQREMGGVVGA
jgi:hydroxymethylbilane synthase